MWLSNVIVEPQGEALLGAWLLIGIGSGMVNGQAEAALLSYTSAFSTLIFATACISFVGVILGVQFKPGNSGGVGS